MPIHERPHVDATPGVLSGFAVLFVLVAVVVAAAGILFASQATAGVALLAAACLLGIIGRMLQASAHTRSIVQQLKQRKEWQ